MRPRYGDKWRVLAHRRNRERVEVENDGHFAELVLEDILHLEQMDNRVWWMALGDASIWIRIPVKGKAEISINFGDSGWRATNWTLRGRPTQEGRNR